MLRLFPELCNVNVKDIHQQERLMPRRSSVSIAIPSALIFGKREPSQAKAVAAQAT